jgi:hypothetical protein
MTWLFLTSKALYLMNETGYFFDKVDLGNAIAQNQYRVELPLASWFSNRADKLRNQPPSTVVLRLIQMQRSKILIQTSINAGCCSTSRECLSERKEMAIAPN